MRLEREDSSEAEKEKPEGTGELAPDQELSEGIAAITKEVPAAVKRTREEVDARIGGAKAVGGTETDQKKMSEAVSSLRSADEVAAKEGVDEALRVSAAEKERPRVTPEQVLQEANGRMIVVGEVHVDREGSLKEILALIDAAHARGYTTLAVEVSHQGLDAKMRTPDGGLRDVHYPGLDEELANIKSLPAGAKLDEHDEFSYMAADATGKRPRMNRQFEIQHALSLGMDVIAMDPNHWNWTQGNLEGLVRTREPEMGEALKDRDKTIVVVGNAHLGGLHQMLGEEIVCVDTTTPPEKQGDPGAEDSLSKGDELGIFNDERMKFAHALPLLRNG